MGSMSDFELLMRGRVGPGTWTADEIRDAMREEHILAILKAKHSQIKDSVSEWVDKTKVHQKYLTSVIYTRLWGFFSSTVTSMCTASSVLNAGSSHDEIDLKSDIDEMEILLAFNKQEVTDTIVSIQDSPGFVLVNLSNASDDTQSRMKIESITKRENGQNFLSAKGTKEWYKQQFQKGKVYLPYQYMPAPPNTVTSKFLYDGGIKEFEIDMAVAIACESWPSEAKPWITRSRAWPDEILVRDIVASGFHLVPKADPDSPLDPDIQWRLSFSLAEKKLTESLSGISFLTYRIVKKLIKEYKTFDTGLCTSYHLKTVFMWMCEQYPEDWWAEPRLTECIRTFLQRFIDACLKRHLPHYFIDKLDLFSKIPHSELESICKQVKHITQDVEVMSWKVPKLSDSLELGIEEIRIAMWENTLLQLHKALIAKSDEPIFELIITESLKQSHKQGIYDVCIYSFIACIFQYCVPNSPVCISAAEYVINCAFAAQSFIYNCFSSNIEKIIKKWLHLFPELASEAFLFVPYIAVNFANIDSKTIDLPNRIRKLRLHYNLSMAHVKVKLQSILDEDPFLQLKGNHQEVLMRLALKPQDFVKDDLLTDHERRFELPKESYLTIHDMANPDIWVKGLTYDNVRNEVKRRGHRKCSGNNCFQICLEKSARILKERGHSGNLHMHRVTCGDIRNLYFEGDHIEHAAWIKKAIQQQAENYGIQRYLHEGIVPAL